MRHLIGRYFKQVTVLSKHKTRRGQEPKLMISLLTKTGKSYTRHVPAVIFEELRGLIK